MTDCFDETLNIRYNITDQPIIVFAIDRFFWKIGQKSPSGNSYFILSEEYYSSQASAERALLVDGFSFRFSMKNMNIIPDLIANNKVERVNPIMKFGDKFKLVKEDDIFSPEELKFYSDINLISYFQTLSLMWDFNITREQAKWFKEE
jgi:hypothetical protein